jgi:serine/threonine protein kinase
MNLRLGDFGSALRINPDDPPHDGIGLGTVSYSSPEIVDPSSERTFSFPSDLFSFGVTMRQCMTGREPYEGLRTVELMYHVRKGNYWEWHARRDIDLPSSPSSTSSSRFPISPTTHHIARLRATTTTATSPIPRSHSVIGTSDGIRRAESLREPSRTRADVHRPALARTPSSDVVVRQSTAVATTSEGGAANVAGTGAGWSTVQDEREGWLRRILDPDAANRPGVEDLLDQLPRIHAIQRGCFG